MQAASDARGVPLALIAATAYVNTRWEWITARSLSDGAGPMNVTSSQAALASSLSGHSATEIATSLDANLDAGAALMAHYHTSGGDLSSWLPAVTRTQGPYVEREIVEALIEGASRTTSTGETITLAPQAVVNAPPSIAATAGATDFPDASWVPADPSNYSVADRPHDYPVDMMVIHDIEGSYGSAIQTFQTPGRAGSAHYVVSYKGQITQMVREKDIAWHAGNWDYNTRSIGIEHEGFAWTPGLYTTAEYNASAQIAASICSRWGVPLDRTHVIGHNQVPDPNNPGLTGGSSHHTDPGPYWNWTYYMAQAQAYAATLPSPPHMMPDPVALNGLTSVSVSWQPARTCRASAAPITGYTVVAQPGGESVDLPATATTYTFTNLTPQTTYTFTVTAHNSYGDDSLTSNPAAPGRCRGLGISASPASPQLSGTGVTFTATTSSCANPQFRFWLRSPGSPVWSELQAYSSRNSYTWSTAGLAPGTYYVSVWAKDTASTGNSGNSFGTWDTSNILAYNLTSLPCRGVTLTIAPAGGVIIGRNSTVTAAASGCPHPQYQFWTLAPGATSWKLGQAYSNAATFNWSTTGLAAGSYGLDVWVRDASSSGVSGNSSGRWDAYAILQYTLTAATPTCTGASLSASPASSALVGTTVIVTGSAMGCANPLYEFWTLAPGATNWQLAQAYSSAATFNWNTAGRATGGYRVGLWVRDASSSGVSGNGSGRWDAYAFLQYRLTSMPCTGASLSASPSSPARAGTAITFTARATGCPNPQYEFWTLAPGATTWQLAQSYSTNATFAWDTTALAAGTHQVAVWLRDTSSTGTGGNAFGTWDAYIFAVYQLT
jgi:hypothetical protein